jgi:hypothetical protein
MPVSEISSHIKLWTWVWQGALRQSLDPPIPHRLAVEMIEGLGGQQGFRAVGADEP